MALTRERGFTFYIRRILIMVLAIALLGLPVLPAGQVFAGEEDLLQGQDEITAADEGLAAAGEEEPAEAPVVIITGERPPLASFAMWSLMNLLLTIMTVVIMAILLIGYFYKKNGAADEEREKNTNKHLEMRLVAIVAAVASLIIFLVTQDTSLPMGFADKYTIMHLIFGVVTLIFAVFSKTEYLEEESSVSV